MLTLIKKPSNIFIDAESNIRVGDFGLATSSCEQSDVVQVDENDQPIHNTGELNASFSNTSHRRSSESLTTGVGTTFYRAPEQGLGSLYDEKVDIFSLGIVLFELFHKPFNTLMERAHVLSILRGDGTVNLKTNESVETMDFQVDRDWDKIASKCFPSTFSKVPSAAKQLVRF